ncbi:MAG: hypothetical protein NTV51_26565 [Verrucomicrobia bacterium]|nr:hypothetical protein [Verrucomicrobiota bacterium]
MNFPHPSLPAGCRVIRSVSEIPRPVFDPGTPATTLTTILVASVMLLMILLLHRGCEHGPVGPGARTSRFDRLPVQIVE